jgi:hypothetical protein
MANVRDPAVCAACGRPLDRQEGRGRQRRYCDATCRSAARRNRSRADNTATQRQETVYNLLAEMIAGLTADAQHADTGPATLVTIGATRRLLGMTEEALRTAVDRARDAGHTWQEIGDVLNTTRQAAFQRFGRPVDPRTGDPLPQDVLPGAAEHAVDVLTDYVEGRHDRVRAHFDDTMRTTLTEEKLSTGRATLAGLVGSYEGMGEPVTHRLGDLTVVDVPMSFEAADMIGRISYHPDGRVAGLFVLRAERA